MADRNKVKNDILGQLEVAHEKIKDLGPDDGLEHRLSAIEDALGALAVYIDKAFAEMRGEPFEEPPPRRQSRDW